METSTLWNLNGAKAAVRRTGSTRLIWCARHCDRELLDDRLWPELRQFELNCLQSTPNRRLVRLLPVTQTEKRRHSTPPKLVPPLLHGPRRQTELSCRPRRQKEVRS